MLFISLVLIIIGAVFLLKNLGYLSVGVWSIIWPLLIVVIGVYLLTIARNFHRFIDRIWKFIEKVEDKMLHPLD